MYERMKTLSEVISKLDTESAIEYLEERIRTEQDELFVNELVITKAQLLGSVGQLQEALNILESCSQAPQSNESALYFAAELLVKKGRFREAVRYLEAAENKISLLGNTYYSDCIYLLHAFCLAKLGNTSQARNLLINVKDRDEELFWLDTDIIISVAYVEKMVSGTEE